MSSLLHRHGDGWKFGGQPIETHRGGAPRVFSNQPIMLEILGGGTLKRVRRGSVGVEEEPRLARHWLAGSSGGGDSWVGGSNESTQPRTDDIITSLLVDLRSFASAGGVSCTSWSSWEAAILS